MFTVSLSGYHLLTSPGRLDPKKPLPKPVVLGNTDIAKILLTAKSNGKASRPHQAFLLLKDDETGLEAPFPLAVKENGKAVVQIVSSCRTRGQIDGQV